MTHPKIDQFVPLVPTMPSADNREFQITIIPQGEQAQSLQKGVSSGDPASPRKHGGPILSLQRDNGGRITHIKIQCNCGQVVDVECLYKEAGKAGQTAKPAEVPKATEPPKAAEPAKAKTPPKADKAKETPKAGKTSKGRK